MSLVERLGFKTLNELYQHMSNNDIMEWMAFDMIKNPETYKELQKKISLEEQEDMSLEQKDNLLKSVLLRV